VNNIETSVPNVCIRNSSYLSVIVHNDILFLCVQNCLDLCMTVHQCNYHIAANIEA
jgi:hypothetical protein